MLVEQVRKLSAFDRMIYWIKERQQIYIKKAAGLPKPWSKDEILQKYYFCNCFREQDKTTVWFRENIRAPLDNTPAVFMATVIFRWFNKIETGKMLLERKLYTNWDEHKAVILLRDLNKNQPVFTSAYMIKCGNGPPGCKIPMVCNCITQLWRCKEILVEACLSSNNLESVHSHLCTFRGLGGFMSYEVVTDLRHTYLLKTATDIDTWANPGPGCLRGLSWLLYGCQDGRVSHPLAKMHELLPRVRAALPHMKFEMRDIEHLLCESDKYNRALYGTGKNKRNYNGV